MYPKEEQVKVETRKLNDIEPVDSVEPFSPPMSLGSASMARANAMLDSSLGLKINLNSLFGVLIQPIRQ